ncbi:MAG TPA: hypothetical protein VHV29_17895 [Terriglobales bacterium]|jgi:hypothetical protein|nr:hypothetical protein [Terriglobales bacterium]
MKRTALAVSTFALLAAMAAFAQTSGQKSFDAMKSLTGNWEGKDSQGGAVAVSNRLTAGGSAVVSEINTNMHGKSEDMISMINMDGDRLLLTHYCSAGNQPRMQAALSPDGKSITFTFVDATNLASPEAGHMQSVTFNLIDANHHTEEWHFTVAGKEMVQRFDLQRKS